MDLSKFVVGQLPKPLSFKQCEEDIAEIKTKMLQVFEDKYTIASGRPSTLEDVRFMVDAIQWPPSLRFPRKIKHLVDKTTGEIESTNVQFASEYEVDRLKRFAGKTVVFQDDYH